MPARLSDAQLRALLQDLGRVAQEPTAPGAADILRRAFGVSVPAALARAAQAVREGGHSGFETELLATYERAFDQPLKRDPGCRVKVAALEALDFADYEDAAPFLRGITYRQPEPNFDGPPGDCAAALRARCGFALVRLHHPETLTHLADLLVDSESAARAAAAQALSYHGDPYGAALLRMKLHFPEGDPEVVIECLKAYLELDAPHALPRAQLMLQSKRAELRHGALLALGESRRPEAWPLLERHAASTTDEYELLLAFMAIAGLRLDAGRDFLLARLAAAAPGPARAALEALSPYTRDTESITALRASGSASPHESVRQLVAEAFPDT